MMPLVSRILGRSHLSVPPVIFLIHDLQAMIPYAQEMNAVQANWVILQHDTDISPTAIAPDGIELGLSIDSEDLVARTDRKLVARLASLGKKSCKILHITNITSSDLKIGWPTHRLLQWRERGLFERIIFDANSTLEAEWMVENSVADAVVLNYSAGDMSIRYRVFEAAREAGVALIARASLPLDISFALSDPAIASTFVHITNDILTSLQAANSPISSQVLENAWDMYQKDHPAPIQLRGNHPPEE